MKNILSIVCALGLMACARTEPTEVNHSASRPACLECPPDHQATAQSVATTIDSCNCLQASVVITAPCNCLAGPETCLDCPPDVATPTRSFVRQKSAEPRAVTQGEALGCGPGCGCLSTEPHPTA